jgi:hypothetical protein
MSARYLTCRMCTTRNKAGTLARMLLVAVLLTILPVLPRRAFAAGALEVRGHTPHWDRCLIRGPV